jgi:DTW domain-containing protein
MPTRNNARKQDSAGTNEPFGREVIISGPDYLRRRKASVQDDFVPRAFCFRCWKTALHCLCQSIALVNNRTRVTIIQHHRERFHPIGTARIARLGLKNVQVLVGERHRGLRVDAGFGARTGLLFPHAQARTFSDTPPAQLPDQIVLLDGTWNQAKSLYKANPRLASLSHFVIHPQFPSNYRIRRQPKSGYLSTIEALVQALEELEPDIQGLPGLLEAFDRLVSQQLEKKMSANSPLALRAVLSEIPPARP